MAMPSPINPINFLINREYNEKVSVKNGLIRGRLSKATNLFSKDLLSHYGCVNAIEFSNEGEFLISGGDDRRVLLWSVPHSLLEKGEPVAMSTTHISNIFCLGFSSTNHRIFSAGNDDQLFVHDTRSGYLIANFLHEKPVYGLSINPQNDNVFASAGEDGRILIYDIREPSANDPLCLAKYKTAFHAVMFNPVDPRFVATANTEEGIALWDNRKPRQHLIRYGNGARQNSGMSVRFNSLGTKLLALRRRLPPILYAVESDVPLCQFYHPDYYNSCTMKSCSFAGENDEYVLSGSDDFNLYMWEIPKDGCDWGTIHIVLVGHRSIVNQVRYNKQNDIIASSGVEKMVKFWSTLDLGGFKGSIHQPSQEKPRQVFTHEEYISLVQNNGQLVSHDYSHQSTSEDARMMAFFDSLVQREIEGWVMSDETLSSSDYDSSTNVDNGSSQMPPDSHRSFSSDKKGNRIAELIYEKREKLAKMARQKYNNNSVHRHKKRERQRKRKLSKLKSSFFKPSSKKSSSTTFNRKSSSKQQNSNNNNNNNNNSSSSSSSSNLNNSNSKQTTSNTSNANSIRHNNNNNNNNNVTASDRIVTLSLHKHKYKTRSNVAREREEIQSNDSLDVPSTSTGITASTSATNTVYRIYDQDSDDDGGTTTSTTNPTINGNANGYTSNNGELNGEQVDDQQQPLINILPTPLNGTHDMFTNILQVPISNGTSNNTNNNNNNTNNVVIPPAAQINNYNDDDDDDDDDEDNNIVTTRSRSNNNNNNRSININNRNKNNNNRNSNNNGDGDNRSNNTSDESDTEIMGPVTPASRKYNSNCDVLTPDSGIVSGPCSSSASMNSVYASSSASTSGDRDMRHHLDDNSDDPDWAYESFKKRVKRARFNIRKTFGADSDSN